MLSRSKWLRCLSSNLCVASTQLWCTVWCTVLVHTALVQTVLVHCRGGGRGGLQAFSGSPQIHSKCLPHSQPHCQPPLSGLHTFSMPATRLSQSDPHLTLSIFAPRLTWSHVSLTWHAPLPPLIYTLCSASTCAPICHQAGALSMALVARLFRLTALGCGSFQRLRCIFFPTFCFDNSPDYTDYISLKTQHEAVLVSDLAYDYLPFVSTLHCIVNCFVSILVFWTNFEMVWYFTNCILDLFCIVFYCCALCIWDAHFGWHVNCRALWHKWHSNHKALFTDNYQMHREWENQPTGVPPGPTKVPTTVPQKGKIWSQGVSLAWLLGWSMCRFIFSLINTCKSTSAKSSNKKLLITINLAK